MKFFRVDYTVPGIDSKRVQSIFLKADNLTLAKHQVSNMPYTGWDIKKIEVDSENNYQAWLEWKYEPNFPAKK